MQVGEREKDRDETCKRLGIPHQLPTNWFPIFDTPNVGKQPQQPLPINLTISRADCVHSHPKLLCRWQLQHKSLSHIAIVVLQSRPSKAGMWRNLSHKVGPSIGVLVRAADLNCYCKHVHECAV